ncbi:MAG: hypothetical protein U0694_27160 [Anaerolineae bacterium]
MDSVQKRSGEISTGVFLIGLAILFMTGYWWPGIMFVIGISSIARALGEGKAWYAAQGGLWAIGIGLVFAIGFSLPLLLIMIGISMLLGFRFKPPMFDDEKRKNEEFA